MTIVFDTVEEGFVTSCHRQDMDNIINGEYITFENDGDSVTIAVDMLLGMFPELVTVHEVTEVVPVKQVQQVIREELQKLKGGYDG